MQNSRSMEEVISAMRRENRVRHDQVKQTLAINDAQKSLGDALAERFVTEARERFLSSHAREIAVSKGIDDNSAREQALILYEKECQIGNPEDEFGEYATTHFP